VRLNSAVIPILASHSSNDGDDEFSAPSTVNDIQ
jgi:hypothetical protein